MSGIDHEKKGNIIPFPNVKERLLQFGTNALQNEDPEEAVKLLEEALRYDSEDDRILWSLIAAYMEVKDWEKAKNICQEMLKKGIGSYFMVFETFIKTLIELRDFDSAKRHISALLEEQSNEIDVNVKDRLEKLLSFIEKRKSTPMPNQNTNETRASLSNLDDRYWFQHLHVFQQDIRPYIKEIEEMLEEEERHPFLKTVMLHALIEQNYEQSVIVTKFGQTTTFVPKEAAPFNQRPFYQQLLSTLKQHLENDNPTLFDNLTQLIERNFFILYPFQLEPKDDENAWACAYHLKGNELYGLDQDREDMIYHYKTSSEDVQKAIGYIEFLEAIPFPEV